MAQGWFAAPVSVTVGIFGSIRNIISARQADELLRERLRHGGSPKILAAHHACRAAMEDEAKAEAARMAFIEAAREARLLPGN
ncbi:DUF982 domain-containing protein [Mesorhizobium sp. B2-1-8]|uniref:DUF982 domain-containing protein n=1 Tax=unclassified Mesorhizobium TaxID=325217 RepID=UPI001129971B|nr:MULTISPECIES: DUF982 domain-containing protein [unclassified Mesorhizobium]MBZ9672814.1 DUF982 domain-containing protein [Mesorhizobium sp. ES1-3]MBZ9706288.1 DUF982 domain-containing protein [Mesorhizobium sp. ESP7-2]UCI21760.1 DUF982 domain-containing protein [Mesorhizobium sp. B2-1-8]